MATNCENVVVTITVITSNITCGSSPQTNLKGSSHVSNGWRVAILPPLLVVLTECDPEHQSIQRLKYKLILLLDVGIQNERNQTDETFLYFSNRSDKNFCWSSLWKAFGIKLFKDFFLFNYKLKISFSSQNLKKTLFKLN